MEKSVEDIGDKSVTNGELFPARNCLYLEYPIIPNNSLCLANRYLCERNLFG
jgi:hypothetical protein